MSDLLFLSPHLDDAALSCAGRILTHVSRGDRVVVATLFSEGDDARKEEDLAAWRAVGVEARHLGLEDAPFRLGRALTFESLMLGPPPGEDDVARARAKVAELLSELAPSEVWLPLGIGGHVDHEAAFECHPEAGASARFYFDRPYSFVHGLCSARLGEGTPFASGIAVEAQLRAVRLMDRFFAPKERAGAVDRIAERIKTGERSTGLPLEVRAASFANLDEAAALIGRYPSQVRWIFGKESVADAYRRLARDQDGELIERCALAMAEPRSGTP